MDKYNVFAQLYNQSLNLKFSIETEISLSLLINQFLLVFFFKSLMLQYEGKANTNKIDKTSLL